MESQTVPRPVVADSAPAVRAQLRRDHRDDVTAGIGYQTLPLWFADNFSRPNAIPTVNVVATFVVLVSIIPVYIAQRLIDRPIEPGAAAT